MNANESRQKAEERRLELSKQQWSRIIKEIINAIKLPAEEVVFHENISPENIQKLREADYTLSREGGRQGDYSYRISWKHIRPEDDESDGTTYYPGGISTNHPPL